MFRVRGLGWAGTGAENKAVWRGLADYGVLQRECVYVLFVDVDVDQSMCMA